MAELSQTFTIFYAWQSDAPSNQCRSLIEGALNNAAQILTDSDENPFHVQVVRDTRGEPGLCDIPAVILRKIADADAFVGDMTLVASTDGDEPKLVPNANVAIELGYALSELGDRRIILVLNEAHGDASHMPFDIAHRRRPISYSWPREGEKTRSETIADLTAVLVDALKPVLDLGSRSMEVGGGEYDLEIQEIESLWRSRTAAYGQVPTLTWTLHPAAYRSKKWNDVEQLESGLRSIQFQSGYHMYPPERSGTGVTQWGLYNDTYERPTWALTYSGLFWASVNLSARREYTVSERDRSIGSRRERMPSTISANDWIDFHASRSESSELFFLSRQLAAQFHGSEAMVISARADCLAGKYFGSDDPYLGMEISEPTISPYCAEIYRGPASELIENWAENCIDFQFKLYSMFDRFGRRIACDTLMKWLQKQLPRAFADSGS